MVLGTHQGTLFLKISTLDTKRGSYRLSARKKPQRAKNRTASNFWMVTLEARRQESNNLKILRRKDFQNRILYPKSQNIASSVSFKAAIGKCILWK